MANFKPGAKDIATGNSETIENGQQANDPDDQEEYSIPNIAFPENSEHRIGAKD
jgi:hypothetical protein